MDELPSGSPPRRSSLAARARIYLVGSALLALALGFVLFALGWSQYAVRQRTDDMARQVVALAKGRAVANESTSSTVEASSRLFRVESGLINAALFVTDSSGRVLLASAGGAPESIPLEKLAARSGVDARTGVLRNAAGTQVLVVAASIDGSHELVAVQSLSEISAAQTSLWAIAAVSLAVAALVMYAAGGVLARRLTAPLVRLERAAESVAAGQFGTQVEAQGDLETVSLARSFNRMSTRVADAYSAQKAFVADVSHEIRTPLTSIRGFAEALLDGTVVGEGPQRHAATVIRDESIRIAEVSDTLLAMAELDAGTVQFARTFVDNRLLADALRGRFAGVADQKGQRLGIELSADDRALADQERLLQALTALVSNAVAYTPSGGTVMVTVGRRGGRVVFAVDDSGPGVPAERRAEVFGRFTRLESSRSARTGGAGLGLAICRRIIESMDGTVAVCDSELGGARFEIDLPAT